MTPGSTSYENILEVENQGSQLSRFFINHSLSIRFLIPASFSRFPVNSLFSLHK